MSRRWSIVALAAAATMVILGSSNAQGIGASEGGFALVPVLALIAAATAIAIALIAVSRANRAQADFTRVTRSIEMALRDLSSRSERDAASIGELNRKIGEEIRSLTEALPAEPTAAPASPTRQESAQEAPQIVRLPSERAAESDAGSTEGVQRALVRAVASGEAEISLQPIISVSQSAASGFEVHMHLEPGDGGRAVDIRRLAQAVPGLDPAGFETAMVRAAIAAGRRQLGSSAERMPFHLAVSEALLASAEVNALAELADVHKALPASLMFSIPAALLAQGGEVRAGIDRLTAAGFRLAAENWDGSAEDAEAAGRRGVAYVKIAANRLLDREKSRKRTATGAELAAAAQEAGLTVVATDVSRDEDAVGLIDLGIDLMVGERFSGPRRIRSAAARQAAMTGT